MALVKTLLLSFLAVVLVLSPACEARDFVVGKEKSWKIPSDPHSSYNDWASTQRFRTGDHLVFKYDGKTDSVVEVTPEGYKNCNAQKPHALRSFNDGDTRIELKGPGPLYFISGNTDNCDKGEKLEALLVKEEHHHDHPGTHVSPAPAPAPSTTTTQAPAPAPASGGNSLKNGVLGSAALVFGLGLGLWL